jgi:tetratricopeptide (TPR) repeat protein
MIAHAFISGQVGKAVYENDGRLFLLGVEDDAVPIECRAGDANIYFTSGAEFTTLPPGKTDLSTIKDTLLASTISYRALNSLLGGLDGDLESEVRQLSIEEAEETLSSNSRSYSFVKSRLLARPLPEEADVQAAVILAEKAKAYKVKSLYLKTLESQDVIIGIMEIWAHSAPKFFKSEEEMDEGERLFVDMGVFADMIACINSGDAGGLDKIVLHFGTNSELKQKIPFVVHMLNAIKTEIKKRFDMRRVAAAVVQEEKEVFTSSVPTDPIERLIGDFIEGKIKTEKKKLKSLEAKGKVDIQIHEIEKFIHTGNMQKADRYLYDLIKFNLLNGKREHVGMTLCNLAKMSLTSNRIEFAKKLVEYAVKLEVLDPVIYSMKADILKRKGRFDEALAAYETAIKEFPENEVARNGYAEILKTKGRFDEALAVYEETINDFPEDAFARNGYAETLKAQGRFDDALAAYEAAIKDFPENAIVRTGRLSLLILSNKFDEANSNLFKGEPVSRHDWINYHISAMYYLKRDEIDKAITMFVHGLKHNPWQDSKSYFAKALGFAKIKQKKFDEAEEVLTCERLNFDITDKGTCLVLRLHAQAGLNLSDAANTINELENISNPRIVNLAVYISRRYKLGKEKDAQLSTDEIEALDRQIEAEEEFLLLAA